MDRSSPVVDCGSVDTPADAVAFASLLDPGQCEADGGDSDVDGRGDVSGRGHVVDAQQVEAGEQRAEDGAGQIRAVQQAPPGNAARRGLDAAHDGRQRCAHQNRRRQQADRGDQPAQQHARQAVLGAGDVHAIDERQREQNEDAAERDAEFQGRIHAQRMLVLQSAHARQRQAPDAQPAHERRQQDAERDRGRADGQLQQLEPDDLVDQRGASAAGEQNQQPGQ